MNSTVKDVMSTHVIAVRQNASYKDMAAMLHEQRVSAFPVLDDHNKVIGVVSESDLLTKEALEGTVPGMLQSMVSQREHARASAVTAAELMTKPPVTIGPDEPVTVLEKIGSESRPSSVTVRAATGLPAEALLEAAADADLLVVGSRGAGGFKSLPMGSVSTQVTHHARCPVVVIPDENI